MKNASSLFVSVEDDVTQMCIKRGEWGWVKGILLVFAEHEDAKGAKGIEAGDLLNLVVIKVEKDQTLQAVKKPKGQK